VPKTVRGDLDTFSLPDLLQWLEISRQSGRVTLTRGPVRRSIDLQGGAIVFVSSTRPDERLGSFLVRRGIVAEEVAWAALAENLLTGKNLTRIVLDRGYLTRDLLAGAVEGLAVEVLIDSFRWKGASFEFDPEVPTEDILRISLSLRGQVLAMQGAKAVDDTVRAASGPAPGDEDQQEAEEQPGPGNVATRFWEILGQHPPGDAGPDAIRGLFEDFRRFSADLGRRAAAAGRPAPIFDDTAVLLRRALAEGATGDQLVQAAALDPFLTMNLVSFSNALDTGRPASGTAREAAVAVGPEALRLFLELSSGRDSATLPASRPLERAIRTSAIATAVAASRLAPSLRFDPDLAYTAGLVEPLAGYDPLLSLLAVRFEPGPFRAGVLNASRSAHGRLLARKMSLPDTLRAVLGSTGFVTPESPDVERVVFYAKQLVPSVGIGCEFSCEDPGLVDQAASLCSDEDLLAAIRRDTARLFEIIGL
jgi:hypothetical protein